jgi:UDP-N-acetylmuramate--alanine ligase
MLEDEKHIDNKESVKPLKVIISGGGTGGHIYPAIAIAIALKELVPDVDVLFVGARGRMEMEKVPEAGYVIKGLWISGFQRSLSLKNLLFPFKLLHSVFAARTIVEEFQPQVVVGVGGYASGPTLKAAQHFNIPTVIQEQNSYAGVTNKLLAEKAEAVCVAYEGLERYFPADKIVFTGNPVRKDILNLEGKREEAAKFFKLDPSKKTILVIGGSLGARTINESIDEDFDKIIQKGIQLIWQTGKGYYPIAKKTDHRHQTNRIRIYDFIKRMDLAYAMADVVISRAGALSISELCLVQKPAILVPSPNVAEDHQTKNAMALVEKEAALMVRDQEAKGTVVDAVFNLLANDDLQKSLSDNIGKMGRPSAAKEIALEVLKIAGMSVEKAEENELIQEAVPVLEPEPVKEEPQIEPQEMPASEPVAEILVDREPESSIIDPVFNSQSLKTSEFTHVYLLGAGGIGMSALGRYFKTMGYAVAGYDKSPTALTDALGEEGISIHFDDNVKLVPDAFKKKNTTLVIYTPAVPENTWELNYFRQNGFKVVKRSHVLGVITKGKNTIAIAGTHGKTTTSTLVTHLLHASGKKVSAFLGGISTNFGTNIIIGDKKSCVVVEADEFDRSFLTLEPDIAIVTSTDADHLDIYTNHDSVKEAFQQFVEKMKKNSTLIGKTGLELSPKPSTILLEYGKPESNYRADNIRIENGCFVFDYISPDTAINGLVMQVPGYHNVENAVAAITVALLKNVKPEQIRHALYDFKGVKRRFEYIVKQENLVYIDDYAHHPVEVEALLRSAKALYPTQKVTIVFQPHLYSRTRDFATEFAQSLSLADEVLLLDIYPARELPISGVSSEMVFDNITSPSKKLLTKQSLIDTLVTMDIEVLITAGAGDIDKMIEPISKLLVQSSKFKVQS